MLAGDAPRLSTAERDSVLELTNTIRDAVHQDVAERDAFLVKSANTILQFQAQVASFVESKDVGESVFTIRNALLRNGFRTGGPFGRVLANLNSFAAAITAARKVNREREAAAETRRLDAERLTARRERLEALEYAENFARQQSSSLGDSDEDLVSLGTSDPSSDTDVDNPQPEPAGNSSTSAVSRSSPAPFSVRPDGSRLVADLTRMLASTRLMNPDPMTPPPSPNPSSNSSLPDLEPIDSSNCRALVRIPSVKKARRGLRGRKNKGKPQSRLVLPDPILPRVGNVTPRRRLDFHVVPPRIDYIDDSAILTPRYVVSRASGSTFSGSSSRSGAPTRALVRAPFSSNPPIRALKRCHHCGNRNHLIASCPGLQLFRLLLQHRGTPPLGLSYERLHDEPAQDMVRLGPAVRLLGLKRPSACCSICPDLLSRPQSKHPILAMSTPLEDASLPTAAAHIASDTLAAATDVTTPGPLGAASADAEPASAGTPGPAPAGAGTHSKSSAPPPPPGYSGSNTFSTYSDKNPCPCTYCRVTGKDCDAYTPGQTCHHCRRAKRSCESTKLSALISFLATEHSLTVPHVTEQITVLERRARGLAITRPFPAYFDDRVDIGYLYFRMFLGIPSPRPDVADLLVTKITLVVLWVGLLIQVFLLLRASRV
uniref:CCHC-type domain-containing protein n=1 Tax=Mycena chlorophos TaxID=658473 RepID=A0ABQ0KU74_MYCCL|nr:predicted protein [Mycena chlorophos]